MECQSEENVFLYHLLQLERSEAVNRCIDKAPSGLQSATAMAKLPRAMEIMPDVLYIKEAPLEQLLAWTNLSTLGISGCRKLAPGDESGKRQERTKASRRG